MAKTSENGMAWHGMASAAWQRRKRRNGAGVKYGSVSQQKRHGVMKSVAYQRGIEMKAANVSE
jgi:hypothetical protein